FRYAVIDIDCSTGDQLYDLLVDNGFNSFVFLNSLKDHPDFQRSSKKESAPKTPEKQQKQELGSGITNSQTQSGKDPPSPSLFKAAKEEGTDVVDTPDEMPFFEEVSAADLLGGSDERSKSPKSRSDALDMRESSGPSSPLEQVSFDKEVEPLCAVDRPDSDAELLDYIAIEQVNKPTSKMTPKGAFVKCLLCKNMIMVSR
ncbi:unnamed protein product, partial [Strongylus vulgaris]